MQLGKQDTPKVIVLGALIAFFVGYFVYTMTAGKAPARPAPAKEAAAPQSQASTAGKLPANYVGHYVGKYDVDDQQNKQWQGKADLTVNANGTVNGHVWLPTSDGGPGLVSMVAGQVQPSGELTLRSDKAAAGTPDGKLQGTPIERFQFNHNGRLQESSDKVMLIAEGKGSQGFSERVTADKTSAADQVAQVAMLGNVARRDPFAPCLTPEQFQTSSSPVVRPSRPLPSLGKLPSFTPPTNTALGIRPLPPVPSVAVEADPQFVLTGVIVGPTNVAIIRAGEGERHIVREGQIINGKYLVRSISRDQVILRDRGRQIYLKLGGSSNAS